MNVLVVDDDREVLDLVVRALERDGHRVRASTNLEEARAEVVESPPEVLVLDLALPDGSGIGFCRELRAGRHAFPILLLTAHGEVPRRVEGLDAGADDFLAKPFAVAELRARVRALGRRGPVDKSTIARHGEVELDFASRRAYRDGVEVPITKREWAVLELLAAREGRVATRVEILDSAWGEITDAATASLDVLVARIRRKLGPAIVRTVRGEGYALGAE